MSALLIKCLKAFSISDLTEVLGPRIVEGLSKFDIPIEKTPLIDTIISNNGFSVLKDNKFRKILIDKNKEILAQECREIEELYTLRWSVEQERIKLVTTFGGRQTDGTTLTNRREILETIEPSGETLFGYQNWMRKRILDFLISDTEKTLVHMPTGAGKTKTTITAIIDFIRHRSPLDVTVIWMAHSDELCEQAIDSFHELWQNVGLAECNVWRMWGGFRELDYKGSGANFVVTSFQSAYAWIKAGKNEVFEAYLKIKGCCDLLLVDEAHMSTAPTYAAVISNFARSDTKTIGLTATPGRHHVNADIEETQELAKFYDRNLIKMTDHSGQNCINPIKFLQNEKILSRINREVVQGSNFALTEYEVTELQQNLEISPKLLKKISTDKQRFLTIANKTMVCAKLENQQVLVFCPSKDNALLLSTYLNNRGCKSAAITSDLDMSDREEKLKNFKKNKIKVLTNFGVLTTGFDAPNIDVVFIARPTLSVVLYSQMIGRGLRGSRVGGTDFVKVIDVQDNLDNLPGVQEAFTFFNDFYN
ncbi:DEAD/DEAH box helicase [Paracoccaceae bacterium]|nr:DEAD/DEAH box helicase [Paracoccaceae bacterium]